MNGDQLWSLVVRDIAAGGNNGVGFVVTMSVVNPRLNIEGSTFVEDLWICGVRFEGVVGAILEPVVNPNTIELHVAAEDGFSIDNQRHLGVRIVVEQCAAVVTSRLERVMARCTHQSEGENEKQFVRGVHGSTPPSDVGLQFQ